MYGLQSYSLQTTTAVVLFKAQGSESDVAGIETQLCYSRHREVKVMLLE